MKKPSILEDAKLNLVCVLSHAIDFIKFEPSYSKNIFSCHFCFEFGMILYMKLYEKIVFYEKFIKFKYTIYFWTNHRKKNTGRNMKLIHELCLNFEILTLSHILKSRNIINFERKSKKILDAHWSILGIYHQNVMIKKINPCDPIGPFWAKLIYHQILMIKKPLFDDKKTK